VEERDRKRKREREEEFLMDTETVACSELEVVVFSGV